MGEDSIKILIIGGNGNIGYPISKKLNAVHDNRKV